MFVYRNCRRYKIPKYLYKRKIEIIRRKILKRKFGYLFYKKTASSILPSQATRHYLMKLKRNFFHRWLTIWYEARVEWKLLLRAQIHYNLSLKQNYLHQWIYYHMLRKARKIKMDIAVLHYEKKFRLMLLRFVMEKWKLFLEMVHRRVEKKQMALDFFKKSKRKSKMLKSRFDRWLIYVKVSKNSRFKLAKAQVQLSNKLLGKYFQQLCVYMNYRRSKVDKVLFVQEYYNRTLLGKAVNSWQFFVESSLVKKQKQLLAHTHFTVKTIRKCLAILKENRYRQQVIRYKLEIFQNYYSFRVKQTSFNKLHKYWIHRMVKQNKVAKSKSYNEKKIKYKAFNGFKKYRNYRREKLKLQQEFIRIIQNKLEQTKIKLALVKWKIYVESRVEKRDKFTKATSFYQITTNRTIFTKWKHFVTYRRTRTASKFQADIFYKKTLQCNCLRSWNNHVKAKQLLRKKFLEAKEFYKRNLMKEGLTLILQAGFRAQEANLQQCVVKAKESIFLSQKYFNKWKDRSIYRNIECGGNDGEFIENKENIVPRNLDWYQICFLSPRLPNNIF